ncbi:hypothetical protein ACJMK2_006205 [Sinanodonta woodiana]|uniref:Retrotransposon gag domain-containing protein n=1 Tax=Sinanodonta woodiana TaxID=1069815 RepID=A0ABD3VSF1_SINWO
MGKKKTQGQGAKHPLADRTQVQDDVMSYELETNTGVRCPVLELSESSGIVKEHTLDDRSPRREEELPATKSSRMAGRRRSFYEEQNRLRRFGAAAMLQTKGDKLKYYRNTATVHEDTGQYSIDLNKSVAAAINTAVTGILLRGMTTRTETSKQVIPAVAPKDKLTETRRHDRASTSARARMSRVSIGNADEGNLSSSDGSESEEEKYSLGNSGSNLSRGSASTNRTTGIKSNGVKLPAFTGKENWKVWINHFTAVAERRRWTKGEKLDELLLRLHGAAGEFVVNFRRKLNNFDKLVQELNTRYRVIETAKTYAGQFCRRNQRPHELVEEYAAELKRLARDRKTRREDLLRRFLDGLHDEDARFQVEYIKNQLTSMRLYTTW